MCCPHKDSDMTFGPVRHFGWTQLFQTLVPLRSHSAFVTNSPKACTCELH